MVCFIGEPDTTGKWEIKLEGEGFPIYRAAVKGERVLPMEIECESIKTGKRKRFEVEAKPLRDMGGLGKHVSFISAEFQREQLLNCWMNIADRRHDHFQGCRRVQKRARGGSHCTRRGIREYKT